MSRLPAAQSEMEYICTFAGTQENLSIDRIAGSLTSHLPLFGCNVGEGQLPNRHRNRDKKMADMDGRVNNSASVRRAY
jgi:hypothetical protein